MERCCTVRANGKPNLKGHFVDVTLNKGMFKVEQERARQGIEQRSTYGRERRNLPRRIFSATGPITLSDGTGAYTGISGTLTTTLTFGGVGPLYTTWNLKKGKCNMSKNAPLVAQFGTAVGHGTIKLA